MSEREQKLAAALAIAVEWLNNIDEQTHQYGVVLDGMPNNVPGRRVLAELAQGESAEFDQWFSYRGEIITVMTTNRPEQIDQPIRKRN